MSFDPALALALREAAESIRRKPTPLSVLIPLMQKAADALETHEAVNVEITQQSFFDLLNEADKEGTAYSFVRRAPVNKATGERHVNLVSEELDLVIAIELKNPAPVYFLKIGS